MSFQLTNLLFVPLCLICLIVFVFFFLIYFVNNIYVLHIYKQQQQNYNKNAIVLLNNFLCLVLNNGIRVLPIEHSGDE